MPLWMSSRQDVGGGAGDEPVDLACDVAFEAAECFATGLAFGDAPVDVAAGAGVPAETGQHDGVEGGVGLPVSAPVEAPTLGFPGGGFDWADAAEGCERGLAAEAFGRIGSITTRSSSSTSHGFRRATPHPQINAREAIQPARRSFR